MVSQKEARSRIGELPTRFCLLVCVFLSAGDVENKASTMVTWLNMCIMFWKRP